MYFFKHAEGSTFAEIEHLIGSDVIIRRAFEAIDQAAWTEEELNTYEHITKTRFDNLAVEQQKIEDAEIRVKNIQAKIGVLLLPFNHWTIAFVIIKPIIKGNFSCRHL